MLPSLSFGIVDAVELEPYRQVAPELYDSYEAVWGPAVEAVSVRHEGTGAPVNMLVFARVDEPIVRIATHGLALAPGVDGESMQIELLLTAERGLAGVEPRAAIDFVFDVAAHLLNHGLRPVPPVLMPPSEVSPWPLSALLFDEPLSEPDEIAAFEADGTHVHLVSIVPIHPEEFAYLDDAESTAVAVDRLARVTDHSWTDLRRPPSPAVWLHRPENG